MTPSSWLRSTLLTLTVLNTPALLLAMGMTAGVASRPTTMKDLTFLTRDDCVNTPDMLFNLEDALKALGWPQDFQFINIEKVAQGGRAHSLPDADAALEREGHLRDACAQAPV